MALIVAANLLPMRIALQVFHQYQLEHQGHNNLHEILTKGVLPNEIEIKSVLFNGITESDLLNTLKS